MAGLLQKAIAGGAGALKESSFEMIRGEILAKRDKRLHEYGVSIEKDVRQPFQAAQATEDRASRERLANLKGQGLQNQIAQIELENAQAVKQLRTQYGQAKTEEDRSRISEYLAILTGKDTNRFLPVPLKNELGEITGYDIFDKQRGKFVASSGGGSGVGGGALKDSYAGPNGRTVSRAQVEATAKNRGMTPEQVIEQLGLK